jgi:hypothetical protein
MQHRLQKRIRKIKKKDTGFVDVPVSFRDPIVQPKPKGK